MFGATCEPCAPGEYPERLLASVLCNGAPPPEENPSASVAWVVDLSSRMPAADGETPSLAMWLVVQYHHHPPEFVHYVVQRTARASQVVIPVQLLVPSSAVPPTTFAEALCQPRNLEHGRAVVAMLPRNMRQRITESLRNALRSGNVTDWHHQLVRLLQPDDPHSRLFMADTYEDRLRIVCADAPLFVDDAALLGQAFDVEQLTHHKPTDPCCKRLAERIRRILRVDLLTRLQTLGTPWLGEHMQELEVFLDVPDAEVHRLVALLNMQPDTPTTARVGQRIRSFLGPEDDLRLSFSVCSAQERAQMLLTPGQRSEATCAAVEHQLLRRDDPRCQGATLAERLAKVEADEGLQQQVLRAANVMRQPLVGAEEAQFQELLRAKPTPFLRTWCRSMLPQGLQRALGSWTCNGNTPERLPRSLVDHLLQHMPSSAVASEVALAVLGRADIPDVDVTQFVPEGVEDLRPTAQVLGGLLPHRRTEIELQVAPSPASVFRNDDEALLWLAFNPAGCTHPVRERWMTELNLPAVPFDESDIGRRLDGVAKSPRLRQCLTNPQCNGAWRRAAVTKLFQQGPENFDRIVAQLQLGRYDHRRLTPEGLDLLRGLLSSFDRPDLRSVPTPSERLALITRSPELQRAVDELVSQDRARAAAVLLGE